MTKKITCTCTKKDEPVKHTRKCGLQRSKLFKKGQLVWNMYQNKLTTKDVAIDDEVAAGTDAVIAEAIEIVDPEIDAEIDADGADYPSCPTCCSDVNVECPDCGMAWIDCICTFEVTEWYCKNCSTFFTCILRYDDNDEDVYPPLDHVVPCECKPQKTYCWVCGVKQDYKTQEWEAINKTLGTGNWGSTYTPKCRHYNKSILLPNDVKVYVSSMQNSRSGDDIIPDWGLYLDYGWHPTWRAEHINWPDYGIPKNLETAAEAITYAYDLAKVGGIVEIGCIGGHGRTGTALACMAILAGVPAETVVQWTRNNHCSHAIETKRQEWFPLWFDAYLNGTEPPEMPAAETHTYSGNVCSLADHRKMYEAGDKECTKSKDCTWWKQDLANILRSDGTATGPAKPAATSTPTTNGQQCLPVAENSKTTWVKEGDAWKPLVPRSPCVQCKKQILWGTTQCECGLHYVDKYWNDKKNIDNPKIGTLSGDFIFTNTGWQLKSEYFKSKLDKEHK